MLDKKTPKKNNLFKILMIPVLGIALLVILTKNQKSEIIEAPSFVATKSNQIAMRKQRDTTDRNIEWPGLSIDDLLRHNPFGASGRRVDEPFAVGNEPAETLALPNQIVVMVYMESKEGPVALIDGKIVHEGDQLASGQYITKLTPEFALLAKKP